MSDLTAEEAKSITSRMRERETDQLADVITAYTGRVWIALGYPSWGDYLIGEFGQAPLTVPREDRFETIAALRDAGLSTRAVAAATGVSPGTVRNSTGQNYPVGPVTGVNGKTYAAHNPPPASPGPVAPQFAAEPTDPANAALRDKSKFDRLFMDFDRSWFELNWYMANEMKTTPDEVDIKNLTRIRDELTEYLKSEE